LHVNPSTPSVQKIRIEPQSTIFEVQFHQVHQSMKRENRSAGCSEGSDRNRRGALGLAARQSCQSHSDQQERHLFKADGTSRLRERLEITDAQMGEFHIF